MLYKLSEHGNQSKLVFILDFSSLFSSSQ